MVAHLKLAINAALNSGSEHRTQVRRQTQARHQAEDNDPTEPIGSPWPYPEGYPSDPPKLAFRLSVSKKQYLPGEQIPTEVSVHNQTSHPITFARTLSIFEGKRWRNAYPDQQPMIAIIDKASGEPVPHYYNCLGSEFYRTTDYKNHFLTIEPGETHFAKGWTRLHGLEPSHTYSMCIRDAKLHWWAYGRKSEVLAPGDKGCARIFRKTGIHPLRKFSTVVEPRDGVIKTILGEPVVFSIMDEVTDGEHDGEQPVGVRPLDEKRRPAARRARRAAAAVGERLRRWRKMRKTNTAQ
jgi:hypothetical protein